MNMARSKCSDEEYAYLQRIRNQLISLKIDYRGLEESHDYALRAKRLESAEFLGAIMKRRLEEIMGLEKEIAELEAACYVGE